MKRAFNRKVWCVDGHAIDRHGNGKAPQHLDFRRALCRLPFTSKKPKAVLAVPECGQCIRRLRTPGSSWRVRAEARSGEPIEMRDAGVFDELVVDDWFHIEQMDTRNWWFCVGNGDDVRHYYVSVGRDGKVKVGVQEAASNAQERLDALCAAIRKWHRNDDDDGGLFAHVLKLAGVKPNEACADEEIRANKEGAACPF